MRGISVWYLGSVDVHVSLTLQSFSFLTRAYVHPRLLMTSRKVNECRPECEPGPHSGQPLRLPGGRATHGSSDRFSLQATSYRNLNTGVFYVYLLRVSWQTNHVGHFVLIWIPNTLRTQIKMGYITRNDSSVPRNKHSPSRSYKTNQLMLYSNCCFLWEPFKTHTNVSCGQQWEFLNVKPSGTYSNRTLKDQKCFFCLFPFLVICDNLTSSDTEH